MEIRKREIDLNFLGAQVLDRCPIQVSKEFEEGYVNFVCAFFENLDICCDVFIVNLEPYTAEIDIELTIEETIREVSAEMSKLSSSQKMKAWPAIELAAKNSLEILSFAYEKLSDLKKIA